MKKSCVKITDAFFRHLEQEGASSKTIRTYRNILSCFGKFLNESDGDIEKVTRRDLILYLHHLEEEGRKPTTIQNHFSCLSSFLRFQGKGALMKGIRRPEVRRVRHIAPKSLDRNERNRVLREVERDGKLRNIAIVYLLLYTGLRVSELVALNQEDVTMGERSGSVLVQEGKGNVSRKVPLPVEARYHLKRYLEERKEKGTLDLAPLFLSNYKKRISERSVQYLLKENYNIHPHMLRHTYGRELVANGVDIATVAELMGHADINVTRRYAKPTERELEEAVSRVFG
ncbi:tyrosine-type recombinase/integrase [Thermoactinomyces sp. FSL K6-2592]|uniref:tyrosine-type recombinase/integrase n=1 Tax=Thermoactinomyces sp. FSL K6-2592 TaxID=2975347 RepID=UPI0030F56C17